jgi:hypothetical protein
MCAATVPPCAPEVTALARVLAANATDLSSDAVCAAVAAAGLQLLHQHGAAAASMVGWLLATAEAQAGAQAEAEAGAQAEAEAGASAGASAGALAGASAGASAGAEAETGAVDGAQAGAQASEAAVELVVCATAWRAAAMAVLAWTLQWAAFPLDVTRRILAVALQPHTGAGETAYVARVMCLRLLRGAAAQSPSALAVELSAAQYTAAVDVAIAAAVECMDTVVQPGDSTDARSRAWCLGYSALGFLRRLCRAPSPLFVADDAAAVAALHRIWEDDVTAQRVVGLCERVMWSGGRLVRRVPETVPLDEADARPAVLALQVLRECAHWSRAATSPVYVSTLLHMALLWRDQVDGVEPRVGAKALKGLWAACQGDILVGVPPWALQQHALLAQFAVVPYLRQGRERVSDESVCHALRFMQAVCQVNHSRVRRMRDAALHVLHQRCDSGSVAGAVARLLGTVASPLWVRAGAELRGGSLRAIAPALELVTTRGYECGHGNCAGYCAQGDALSALAVLLGSHPVNPACAARSAVIVRARRVLGAVRKGLCALLDAARAPAFDGHHAAWKLQESLHAAHAALRHLSGAQIGAAGAGFDRTELDLWCEVTVRVLDALSPWPHDASHETASLICALNDGSTVAEWQRWCGGLRRDWLACAVARVVPMRGRGRKQQSLPDAIAAVLHDRRMRGTCGLHLVNAIAGAITRFLP